MTTHAHDDGISGSAKRALPQNNSAVSQVRTAKKAAVPAARDVAKVNRILLVEDQPDFGRLIREYLLDSDSPRFEVRHVESLGAAMEALTEQLYDAALLDLTLPDSIGLQSFQKVFQLNPNLPVVILTGIDDEDVGVAAIKSGAQDFLPKQHLNLLLLTRTLQYAVERKQMEVQLRQSQKMEAIGQLSSCIAHEFNNLLTSIQCNLALLLDSEKLTDAAEEKESLISIKDGANHAAALTRQLLTFSRRQIMEPRVVDFNQVLEGFGNMLKRLLGEAVHVYFSYDTGLPSIKADAGMLEQIILNLAVNARDAMEAGGEVVIESRLARIDTAHVALHPQARTGDFVCLRVADTGCGIAPENLTKIFEPFFTTKEMGKGTGLGLASVLEIVRHHQGWIEVESVLSKGTAFRIYFPVTEAAPEVKKPEGETGSLNGTETILLVEDDPTTRQLVGILLRRYGYNIIASATGAQALQLSEQVLAGVQLLLTDVVMPEGIDGVELSKQLQGRNPDLKVVFMSGYSAEVLTKNITLPERLMLVQKPFDPKFMLRVVRNTLDAKRTA
ncbi:hybrid sensor histidine kinase/response regulator [Pedosphaera parvula]|uniref:histidine kinase n=1 Tax=Pedosphaera parvula (strain Ellin514) TaxID=320771 RepID=B9XHX9_PEDPL|nr:hybrid sensor histidine kinase/response regulator [Pedosphaera parvula]EEF60472.1 histidine kinase [Pedosphaera parvula Ellin514]